MSSEKRRTQNVLRIFLDPLLDALVKFGTNAYMPLLKTDRCLQLLLKLLHTCLLQGSSTQDGEDHWFLLVFCWIYRWYSEWEEIPDPLTSCIQQIFTEYLLLVLGMQRQSSRLPSPSWHFNVYICCSLLILECDCICFCSFFFFSNGLSLISRLLKMITISYMF